MIKKPRFVQFCVILLLCTCIVTKVSGQAAIVVGHVTAEVIESVGAASMAVTGFNLKISNTNTLTKESGYSNQETINLGIITRNSGDKMACNLIVHPAKVSDNLGNRIQIDPTLKVSGQDVSGKTNDSLTIQVNGTANIPSGQASGLYKGTYTMVFAYN
jgi:hypothetical protein